MPSCNCSRLEGDQGRTPKTARRDPWIDNDYGQEGYGEKQDLMILGLVVFFHKRLILGNVSPESWIGRPHESISNSEMIFLFPFYSFLCVCDRDDIHQKGWDGHRRPAYRTAWTLGKTPNWNTMDMGQSFPPLEILLLSPPFACFFLSVLSNVCFDTRW